MRHTLELRTIVALKKTRRRGSALIRARYLKTMLAWGYTWSDAVSCYSDVVDVAELEIISA